MAHAEVHAGAERYVARLVLWGGDLSGEFLAGVQPLALTSLAIQPSYTMVAYVDGLGALVPVPDTVRPAVLRRLLAAVAR